MEKKQEIVAGKGNVSDSNNSNDGNAGRDIVNNYGESNIDKELQASQDNIIVGQRAVIERLQHQIDRMQDQMEVYQKQFTKAQELKEKLMDMLLDDREMLRGKVFNKEND